MATEIEPNSSNSNATSLTSDTRMEGALSSSSDVDTFKISSSALSTASYVSFDFDSPLSSPLTKAYKITVLDGTGTATSTTSSSGSDVSLKYVLPAANANQPLYFQVDANSSSEAAGETYGLKYTAQSISENTQDNVVDSNNSTVSADSLIPAVNFYGRLNSSTDVDLYSFTTGSSGTVTLDFKGFSSSQASNFYTAKITSVNGGTRTTVTNQSGESMSVTPNGAATASQISFAATSQKTYFVEVSLTDSVSYDSSLATNDYTVLVSGTTNFNDEPVITMGTETSGVSGTSRSSGLSSAVAKSSNTSLSQLFSAADPDVADTVSEYYIKLSYSGSNNGGKITYGSTTINADDGTGGYSTIASSDLSSAIYTGGTAGGTQTLKVWAKDSSSATDLSGYSGIISRSLVTTDASATAAINSGSDSDIVEGSNSDYALIDLVLSQGSGAAHTANVIVGFSPDSDITVKDSSGGSVISAVTFAQGETTKQIRVYALNDASAEGTHTGTLGFTVTASDATNDAAFNNLQIANMNFGISEDVATFSNSALNFSSSGATSLKEGDSGTASYTITLSASPENNITVTINAGSDITLSQSELTFAKSASGSDLVKTISATAIDDNVTDEGNETFVITHTVSEQGVAASLLSVPNVSISIIDNDATPVVSDNQSFTVSKALVSGTQFASVVATDADVNDTLTYAIVSGASGLFSISSTGALSTSASIESSVGTYSLVVSASDGTLSDTSTVTVIVSNSTVNVAPIVSAQTVSVSENLAVNGTTATVSASDANGDSLTYSIVSGNDAGLFAINASTGALTLLSNLDYEADSQHVLSVQVSDSLLNHSANITVNVTNENDNAPKFSVENITSVDLSLSSSMGTAVTTISATDLDNDTITYSITGGNSSGFVTINSSTGAITTAKSFASKGTAKYWDGSNTVIDNTVFSFTPLVATSTATQLEISASDGGQTAISTLTVNFPAVKSYPTKTSNSLGEIEFGDYANSSSYVIYKELSYSEVGSHLTSADIQAFADHFSGKTPITGGGVGSVDVDFNFKFNLSDGVALISKITNSQGSRMVLVDENGSSNISIATGVDLTLVGTVLGDLDASYAALL